MSAPQTLSIKNTNGNLYFTSDAYFQSKCSSLNINVAYNGISQIESDNTNILRSINSNVLLETYTGSIVLNSQQVSNSASILLNAKSAGGGISLLSDIGGITANSLGNIDLLSWHSNINIGVFPSANPNDYTGNVNIESQYQINNSCDDFTVIANDAIKFISLTGDITFGNTPNSSIITFQNGNVLLNQTSSTLNRQLDINISKSSNASTGYDGITVKTSNATVASDLTLQTTDSNAVISLGIQPASSIHAKYREYTAYQNGYNVIAVSGPEFTVADIGYSIYWSTSGYTDIITNIGTTILAPDSLFPTNITAIGAYTGATSKLYKVVIDSTTGTYNTFRWSNDGGDTFAPANTFIPITTSTIALENGISIVFSALTGNQLGAYWNFWAKITAVIGTFRTSLATQKMWTLQPYTAYLNTSTISDIQLGTAGNEVARITADGVVSIGQPKPSASVEISSASGVAKLANEYNLNYQINPAIASFPDGTYVITWEDAQQDGSGYGVYAQHYQNNGQKLGAQFQVNITTLANQSYPQISARNQLNSTDYIIVWQSETSVGSGVFDIYAQIFIQGKPLKPLMDIPIYTYSDPLHNSIYPTVAGLADGTYLITWSSYVLDGASHYFYIYGNTIDNAGNIGTKFIINQTSLTNNILPYVAPLSLNDPTLPNGFVVAFMRQYNASPPQYKVFYQLFNSARVAQSASDNQIITNDPSPTITDGQISCCGLTSGGFSVSFYRNFDANTAIYALNMSVVGQSSNTSGTITNISGIQISVSVTSRYNIGELILINTTYTEKIYDVSYTLNGFGNIIGALITLSTGYRSIVAMTYATNSTTPQTTNYMVNSSILVEDAERVNLPQTPVQPSIGIFKFRRPLSQVIEIQPNELMIVWTNGNIPRIYYQLLQTSTLLPYSSNSGETQINSVYSTLKQRDTTTAKLAYKNGNMAGFAMAWDIESMDASLSGIYQVVENLNPLLLAYSGDGANFSIAQNGFVGIGTQQPAELLHVVNFNPTISPNSNVVIQNQNNEILTSDVGVGRCNINMTNGSSILLGSINAGYSNYYQALNPQFESLVAYFTMDGSSGDSIITDISPNGLVGYLNGFDIINCWVPSVINNGLQFVSSSNYVDLGNGITLNGLAVSSSFSISLWVNISPNDPESGNTMYLITNGGNPAITGTYILKYDSSSTLTFIIVDDGSNANTISAVANINDGLNHHIVVAGDNVTNQATLYIDSVEVGYCALTSTISAAPPSARVYLGSSDGTNNIFRGIMDEVRIYKTRLNSSDISALYKYGSQQLGQLSFSSSKVGSLIVDDTGRTQELSIRASPYKKISGSLSTSSANAGITGTDTYFTTELKVGDTLVLNPSLELVVVAIKSDILLIANRPTSNDNYPNVCRKPPITGFYNSDGYLRGLVNQEGNLLIATPSPSTDNPTLTATGHYNPTCKLEVFGDDGNSNSQPFINLINSNTNVSNGSNETRIQFQNSTNAYSSNIQTLAYINGSHYGANPDSQGQLTVFVNNGSGARETMSIKSNGYMGLGYQVAPKGILHILDSNNANVVVMSSGNNQLVYGELNRIHFAGLTSSTSAGSDPDKFALSAIQGCSDSANDNVAGRLDLLTNSADGNGIQQRLSILNNGNVGVSITQPQNLFQVGAKAIAVIGITGTLAGTAITLSFPFTDDNILGGFIVFNDSTQTTRRLVSRVSPSQFQTDVSGSVAGGTPVSFYYAGLNVDTGGNVSIGISTTQSRFHVEGALSTAISIVNTAGTYTITNRDSTLLINATIGTITLVLPAIVGAGIIGRIYIIKRIDGVLGNSVIITTADSVPIEGIIGNYTIATQYTTIRLQNDGSNWWII